MRLPVAKRLPTKAQLAGCVPYLVAGALYLAVGVFFTDFMLSVFVAIGYLLIVVWLLPLAARRLR